MIPEEVCRLQISDPCEGHSGCRPEKNAEPIDRIPLGRAVYDVGSLRKIIKTRGSFPSDEAALNLLRRARMRWRKAVEWTQAMSQLAILFGERFLPSARCGAKTIDALTQLIG